MSSENKIMLCYDATQMKVGCVLLQAIFGGTISNWDLLRFNTDNWLLAPSPDLKRYWVTKEDLDEIIILTKENAQKNAKSTQ